MSKKSHEAMDDKFAEDPVVLLVAVVLPVEEPTDLNMDGLSETSTLG
jgi:hypothetical protein